MIRAMVSAFLVIRLECRRLPITLEDILTAWIHRPGIEVVAQERGRRERLVERLDEVYPF